MRYFKLKNPFRNVKLMLREIDNYYYFIRQLEILKDSGELKHYVLKINDKHCMYGAINLPPELLPVLETEPVKLPPWDPMGALAR